MVTLLIENGADTSFVNMNNQTALTSAKNLGKHKKFSPETVENVKNAQ